MENKEFLRKIIQEALIPILEGGSPEENRGITIENESFEQDDSKKDAINVVDDLNHQDQNKQI